MLDVPSVRCLVSNMSSNDIATKHRGLASWGDRLVPLSEFRRAARDHGQSLSPMKRDQAVSRFTAPINDSTEVEGPWSKVVIFGGVYNNHLALSALLELLPSLDVDATYCLGDLGGFGPSPEKVRPLLDLVGVRVIQGNYEQSLAAGAKDCHCGYTDPRDNHYAALSYAYTAQRCDADFRSWLASLPPRRRVRIGQEEWLLVHGSPRKVNEFLFDSTTPDRFLELLCRQHQVHGFVCTHTGLPWQRTLATGHQVVNVGALGRPANDGDCRVRFVSLEPADPGVKGASTKVITHKLSYDHRTLAQEMQQQNLPKPFIDTIVSGWWTTCTEILPAKERAQGRY